MAFAAAGGAMGYATASPIQTLGNHFYFGDPIPSLGNQLVGLGIGAATGGIMNGTLAAVNRRNFWTGKLPAFGRGVWALNNTPTIPAPANIENKTFSLQNVQKPGANLPQSLRGPNLSNAEIVQIAGEEATMNVTGKGAVLGTFKHSYPTDLIKEYQGAYGNRGLTPNYRFFDNQGKLAILDVMDTKNNVIYDWKFGYPNYTESKFLLTPQMIRYQQAHTNMSIKIFHFKYFFKNMNKEIIKDWLDAFPELTLYGKNKLLKNNRSHYYRIRIVFPPKNGRGLFSLFNLLFVE